MSRMSNLTYVKAYTITCAVSGTPVQGTSYQVPAGVSVVIKAGDANTGTVTFAESSANAVNTGTDNFPLLSGQSATVQVTNTNSLWFDSTVSGDTVRILFEYDTVV